jgi:hypothetical protein
MAVVYITSMAIINGARSAETVIRTVKMGLPTVLKVCVLLHPHSLLGLSLHRADHVDRGLRLPS